jgi:ABC-2 type transport system permease protein
MSDRDLPLPWSLGWRASFAMSLESLLATRRGVATGILLGAPPVLALVYRLAIAAGVEVGVSPWNLYGDWLVALYWLGLALPLSALFHSTAFAEDVEARTIVFLLTRPVSRSALLAGRYTAYVVALLTITAPAVALSFLLLASAGGWAAFASRAPELLRDVGVVALAICAYGALFTLLGVLLRRPVLPGMLFVFGWELLANLPGYLPRVTLAGPLRALVPYRPPTEGLLGFVTAGTIPVPWALVTLVLVTCGSLVLAGLIFSKREYTGEA